jgi:hypothetical protein
MKSKATRYHLEINGVAEGPMSARELTWKIGAASSDDVILFREDGSSEWIPLEGNKEKIQQLGKPDSVEEPISSPPKLRLKKREATTPPFPSDAPPSPQIATDGTVLATDHGHLNAPPPPPGSLVPPLLQSGTGIPSTTAPQLSHGSPAAYSPPPPTTPAHPPAKVSTLLVAALFLSFGIVGYIFLLMKQDVAGSATRSTNGARSREVSGMKYAILSKREAQAWKTAMEGKLSAFGAKAKAEADASAVRTRPLIEKTDEIAAKYATVARALYLVGANASILGISYDPSSASDVKLLRQLEASMEIASPYLRTETRSEMEKLRFRWVASAVSTGGFSSLRKALDEEVVELESNLSAELSRIRPVTDQAADFISRTKFAVNSDALPASSGTTDALGLFDLKLSPGEYYLVGRSDNSTEERPSEWSIGFSVKALAENAIKLNDSNFGDRTTESLWKKNGAMEAERNIGSIKTQAARLRMAATKIESIRKGIDQREADMARLSEK